MAERVTPSALLLTAAERAERQRTVEQAVRAAWSALHRDKPHDAGLVGAFRAWAQAAGTTLYYLCDVVRVASDTSEVAQLLRRAADAAPELGACSVCHVCHPPARSSGYAWMRDEAPGG